MDDSDARLRLGLHRQLKALIMLEAHHQEHETEALNPQGRVWIEIAEACGLDLVTRLREDMKTSQMPTPGTPEWADWFPQREADLSAKMHKLDGRTDE